MPYPRLWIGLSEDSWADTTTPHGKLLLTILGGLAEFERSLIRARTGEGRERAKGRGARPAFPLDFSTGPIEEAEVIEPEPPVSK